MYLDCIDQDWASDPAVSGMASKLAGQLSHSGRPGDSAVEAFVAIGAASVPALIATLTSGNRVARENAARALGCIGPDARAAIPALTKALQDPHPWVQEQASKALEKIGGQAA